jgi:Arc/MetJ-type ribon-helix-helix transcriptional regulator
MTEYQPWQMKYPKGALSKEQMEEFLNEIVRPGRKKRASAHDRAALKKWAEKKENEKLGYPEHHERWIDQWGE